MEEGEFVKSGKTVSSSVHQAVSWFEFVFNEGYLEKHLSQSNPDPSPVELVTQFMSYAYNYTATSDSEKGEEPSKNNKSSALKLLSLKVAAHLKWDLTIFENKFPLPLQQTLLQDLLQVCCEGIELSVDNLHSLTPCQKFSVALYHRWVLAAVQSNKFPNSNSKLSLASVNQNPPQQVPAHIVESILRGLECELEMSIAFLSKMCELTDWAMPTLDTFCFPHESSTPKINHQWNKALVVPDNEIRCHLWYELGKYSFFCEQYVQSRQVMIKAQEAMTTISEPYVYCSVNKAVLKGYCAAMGANSQQTVSLRSLLLESINNNYKDLLRIFLLDNVALEIPMLERLHVESALRVHALRDNSLVKEYLAAAFCNTIRSLLHEDVSYNSLGRLLVQHDHWAAQLLCEIVEDILPKITPDKVKLLRDHLLYSATDETPALCKRLRHGPIRQIFDEDSFVSLGKKLNHGNLDLTVKWPKPNFQAFPELEIAELESQLAVCFDPYAIRDLIQVLAQRKGQRSSFNLPIILEQATRSIPNEYVQELSATLLSKSNKLLSLKSYDESRRLLEFLISQLEEARFHLGLGNKCLPLSQQVMWEILFVDITRCLDKPPAAEDIKGVAQQAKECLVRLMAGDATAPRNELGAMCVVFLLNVGDWEFLSTIENRRNGWLELGYLLTKMATEILMQKPSRQTARDLFETLLPVFAAAPSGQKRSLEGYQVSLVNRNQLSTFILNLRNRRIIDIMLAVLCRFHNIIMDDTNSEITIHTEPMLWPVVMANANAYSLRVVREFLSNLLTRGLHQYTMYLPWMHIRGDYCYALGQHAAAMRHYVEFVMLQSKHFTLPLDKNIMDECMVRRMVRCCVHLHFYTQAAVLCQFLEEADYMSAFKSVGERFCCDGGDVYYPCIWDITLLEYLIHLHAKRGENGKKQAAMNAMGALELNSNNNEEIKKEAMNLRKSKFMRALASQYL